MSLIPLFDNNFTIENSIIKIEESSVGIGGMTWDASLILAKFIEKNKESFRDVKRIIELGSGTGLCGIACAKLLPQSEVVLTDNKTHLNLIRQNIEINEIKNAICEELDWFSPRSLGNFDLVLGSDLVYEKDLFEPLLDALDITSNRNTRLFLCNELRMNKDLEFYKAAMNRGWTLTIMPENLLDSEYLNTNTPIVRFLS